jgi:PPOX class probable FMN-dependent enzyme
MFVTDARSQKLSQIEQNNKCEACWYFPNTREQFRIAGHLEAIGNGCTDPVMQAARFAAWQALSDPARMQFAWPPPCQLRTEDTLAFALPPPDPAIPLPNFCLLLLNPEQVDRLELRGKPQNRWLYRLEAPGTWSMQAINP